MGTEALAAGRVNRYQLEFRHDRVYRNVYVPTGHTLSPADRALAAWLWSGRRATVAGLSAAALLGSKWIDAGQPAEVHHSSKHRTKGIVLHSDHLAEEEVCVVHGVRVTTPARTAFDLARRRGLTTAVIRIDALMRATGVRTPDITVLGDRHQGARGVVQMRRVLDLADAGAESPQETRTRLVLTSAGLRPARTQIDVCDAWAGGSSGSGVTCCATGRRRSSTAPAWPCARRDAGPKIWLAIWLAESERIRAISADSREQLHFRGGAGLRRRAPARRP